MEESLKIPMIIVGAILVIARFVEFTRKDKKEHDEIPNAFKKISDFTITDKLISVTNQVGFAYDEQSKKICFITKDEKTIRIKRMKYSDILSVELLEQGVTTIKTSRTSQAGSALVGGLLLGPLGAVVGGLSGKKTSQNIMSGYGLRVTVNNTSNPIYNIDLHSQQATHWLGLIQVLIKQADEADSQQLDTAGKSDNFISDVSVKFKNCPFCAEKILSEAKKCKHCGEWLERKESV